MFTVAFLLPFAVGLKVTSILQLAPPPTLAPQSLESTKSLALIPALMPDTLSTAVSVLVRIDVLAAVVVPTAWLPNDNVFGLKLTTLPVPLSATACGLAGS